MAITDRPLRSDAARNQARILKAAREAFAEGGLDVSVDEVARRAGVGKGTLYRRYPTKEALVWATVDWMLEQFEALAEEAAAEPHPGAAFDQFVSSVARLQADNIGYFEAISSWVKSDQVPQGVFDRFQAAVGGVLTRAQEAGAVRLDLEPADFGIVLKMLSASCQPAHAYSPEHLDRYVALMLDAMRPGGAPLPGERLAPPVTR